jgi:hypothetical protein
MLAKPGHGERKNWAGEPAKNVTPFSFILYKIEKK